MEEIESGTEAAEEQIHHHAQHSKESWIFKVALTSAILAVLAAVSALMSNHHANEAMIEQIQSSDQWNYYQAKGIKSAILAAKLDLLKSLGKPVREDEAAKFEQYKKDQEQISDQAKEKERSSEEHLKHHMVLARAVTMFQVAIGIAAISVLTRRRRFWYVSIGFGLIGAVFLALGILVA